MAKAAIREGALMDGNVKAKVPAIRFNGFDGAWQQDVLGNMASFTKGQGYSKSDLCDIGTPIILYGRLYTNYQTGIYEVNTFAQEKYGSVKSKGNEVIVPASGETAEDIARASAVLKSDIVLGGDLNIIYPNENLNPYFLSLTLSNGKPQRELARKAQGKSVVHVRNSDLQSLDVSHPKVNEQKKISCFFERIDISLEYHQDRLDKLNNLKQAMLQKMFPQGNATEPEIRFKGFSGEWVEDYLGNRVEFFSGLTYSPLDVQKGKGTLVLRSSNVKEDEIIDADNVYVNPDIVNCKNVEVGDIAVVVRNGSRNLIGKHAMVKTEMKNTVIGAFMTGISSSTPNFINALLSTERFKSEVDKNLGATINQITIGSFRSMKFYFTDKHEEEKIGTYFLKLDELIALERTQLDKLKQIKQACLAGLFV